MDNLDTPSSSTPTNPGDQPRPNNNRIKSSVRLAIIFGVIVFTWVVIDTTIRHHTRWSFALVLGAYLGLLSGLGELVILSLLSSATKASTSKGEKIATSTELPPGIILSFYSSTGSSLFAQHGLLCIYGDRLLFVSKKNPSNRHEFRIQDITLFKVGLGVGYQVKITFRHNGKKCTFYWDGATGQNQFAQVKSAAMQVGLLQSNN